MKCLFVVLLLLMNFELKAQTADERIPDDEAVPHQSDCVCPDSTVQEQQTAYVEQPVFYFIPAPPAAPVPIPEVRLTPEGGAQYQFKPLGSY
jgi:hypothetical protein